MGPERGVGAALVGRRAGQAARPLPRRLLPGLGARLRPAFAAVRALARGIARRNSVLHLSRCLSKRSSGQRRRERFIHASKRSDAAR